MGAGFESFGLELPLVQAVREMGFGEPFPIQAMAIAPLLEGRDLDRKSTRLNSSH